MSDDRSTPLEARSRRTLAQRTPPHRWGLVRSRQISPEEASNACRLTAKASVASLGGSVVTAPLPQIPLRLARYCP